MRESAPMAVQHYENFPVASWLCPAQVRPAIVAIYHFARVADDLADEGDVCSRQRLASLAAFRADLHASLNLEPLSSQWPEVFIPLAATIKRHQLPVYLLDDLISAFEQDVDYTSRGQWYASHQGLIDYAQRSANPVGRLLLHLYGVHGEQAERESDAICTALQLINFWQDLSVDVPRQRYYLPLDLLGKNGLSREDVLLRRDSPAMRKLVAQCCDIARQLMLRGRPLPARIGGSAGLELRLVMAGGLRILDKIAAQNYSTLQERPKLHWWDAPSMLSRAICLPTPR